MRPRRLPVRPETAASAKEALRTESYQNFAQSVMPGGFRHLRSRWVMANKSGATEKWRGGPPIVESRRELVAEGVGPEPPQAISTLSRRLFCVASETGGS